MVGRHHIEVENRKVKYILDIERKITVIKGNSGTGKTTLIRMLQGYLAQGHKSGIRLQNDSGILLEVFDMTTRWDQALIETQSRIIFIDEATDYIYSKAFQEAFVSSNHYLVVISRSGRFNHLPYAVNSIYELKTEVRENVKLTKLYQLYRYEEYGNVPQIVITEDSNSGAEMMENIFGNRVISARGNGNVSNQLADYCDAKNPVYVIVDGAAYGGFIANTMGLARLNENIKVFAPESFEYLILRTDAYKRQAQDEIENTWKYCDIAKYLTWEQYYTELLEIICKEVYGFAYTKSHLHKSFANDTVTTQVKNNLLEACVQLK